MELESLIFCNYILCLLTKSSSLASCTLLNADRQQINAWKRTSDFFFAKETILLIDHSIGKFSVATSFIFQQDQIPCIPVNQDQQFNNLHPPHTLYVIWQVMAKQMVIHLFAKRGRTKMGFLLFKPCFTLFFVLSGILTWNQFGKKCIPAANFPEDMRTSCKLTFYLILILMG